MRKRKEKRRRRKSEAEKTVGRVRSQGRGKSTGGFLVMNKNELVSAVADAADLPKKDADAAVTALVEVITQALKEGDKVQLVGFGTFELRKRSARITRNPRTQEPMEVAASVAPVFKAGKILKDAVARKE